MIFFRSLANPTGTVRPLRTVRLLCAAALTFYPVGAMLREFGPDRAVVQIVGLALILASLVCAGLVLGSRLNRITGEVAGELDEYELRLRSQAMEGSYVLFVALTVCSIIYLALAADFGWWLPRGYDQWNGIFWGAFITASLLPTTLLAFQLKPGEFGGDEEGVRP